MNAVQTTPASGMVEVPGGDPSELLVVIALGLCATGLRALHRAANRKTATNDVMSADEVAALLRLDRKTVYDYAGRGVIPHRRIGKRMLFSRVALVQWLGSCSKGSSDGGSG